jgi:hypothetical protein
VLREGKGFSSLATIRAERLSILTGLNGGAFDVFYPCDMMLNTAGDTLNIMSLESLLLQQGASVTMVRSCINPITNAVFAPPMSNLDDLNLDKLTTAMAETPGDNRNYGFAEGTGRFFLGSLTGNNFGQLSVLLAGNIKYQRGLATFAGVPRATVTGEAVEEVFGDVFARVDGRFGNRIFAQYQGKNLLTFPLSYEQIVTVREDAILKGAVEPLTRYPSPVLMFLISKKKLYVAQSNIPQPNPAGSFAFLDSIALPATGNWTGATPQIMTRRTLTGDAFGILVSTTEQNPTFFSASFNKATGRLTQNINGIQIPNFETGNINFDIDPQGNMYFDNKASTFTSDSAISLYKASAGGFSTIGQDDIIKSGSVQLVRWLNGKVYAAVGYSWSTTVNGVQGSKNRRIAIIRAD